MSDKADKTIGVSGIQGSAIKEASDLEGGGTEDTQLTPMDTVLIDESEPIGPLLGPLEIATPPSGRIVNQKNGVIQFNVAQKGNHQVWIYYVVDGTSVITHEGQWYEGERWNHLYSNSPRPGVGRYEAYWRFNSTISQKIFIDVYVSDLPVIDYPAQNAVISTQMPRISGKGGGDCSLRVVLNRAGYFLENFSATRDEWYLYPLNDLPYGEYSFHIEQSKSGYFSRNSAVRSFKLYGAKQLKPLAGEVLRHDEITFKGESVAGAVVLMVKADDHYVVLSPPTTVPSSGSWEVLSNPMLPSGELKVQAQWRLDAWNYGYSDPVTFKVLGVPVITSPAGSSAQEQTFTLSGNNGLAGAEVEVYRDALLPVHGCGTVQPNGSWTAAVSLNPGPASLVALQKHSGKESLRGASVTFKIRPPKLPVITVTYPNETTVRLAGTAYNAVGSDTKVHIHYKSDSSPALPDVAVSNGIWTKDITGLLPSRTPYAFDVQQSVTDGVDGRIKNTGWTAALVTVICPKPVLTTPTLNGQIPTFSGARNVWEGTRVGAIQIQLNGQTHTLLPELQGSAVSWTLTATGKIAPGSYPVKARQGINSVWSEFAVLAAPLVIRPDLPELIKPPAGVETPQEVQFHGKTWPNAKVVVRFKNGEPIREVTSNETTGEWSFNYTLPLGEVEVQVLSTFGGQTSEVKNQSFPVKTPPPTITFPTANNNEVPPKPVIEGTGIAGCWVHVYSVNTNAQLGRGQVDTDKTWKVTLDEQNLGDVRIYTKQIFNTTYASNETDALLIKVVVPSPSIETPGNGTKPARTFTVSGEDGWPGGVIDLKFNGQPTTYEDIEVQADGLWQVVVTSVVGALQIKAVQRYKGVPSKDSLACSVTVVPAVPVIDTPREGELMSETVVFSGFGYAGDSVKLYRRGLPFEMHGPVPVSPQGTWSFPLRWAEPGKPFTVTVEQIAPGNYVSAMSPSRNFTLLSTAPTITAPVEGDWVGVRPEFSGLATPRATISVASWFDTADLLAETEADNDGRWRVVGKKALPVGAAWVVVRQTLDGTASEWAESGRFMVE